VGSANLSFSPPLRRRGYRERWSPFKVVRGRGMFERNLLFLFEKKGSLFVSFTPHTFHPWPRRWWMVHTPLLSAMHPKAPVFHTSLLVGIF